MAGTESSNRKTFIWTALSGCVYALSSVVFLTLVTRQLGDTAAGVYATASMIAMQLITVGKFSVRNFQVSDVKQEFTFSEYFSFRIFTCILMLLGIVTWGLIGGYRGETLVVIVCFGVYKICDAISDVFEGRLQQSAMLSRAGMCQFLMNLVLIAVFVMGIFITGSLMVASITLAVASIALLWILYVPQRHRFGTIRWTLPWRVWKGLVVSCGALCISSFLYSFMNNAPRFAISWQHTGEEGLELLGRFSQLFMPVFAVDLLAGFTMRMWITPMARQLEEGNEGYVRGKMLAQSGIILGITAIACAFAYLVGCPVLGWFYQNDLSGYEGTLTLLMLAGGFVAFQTLFENVIIIYRGQKATILVNIIVVLFGAAATWFLVKKFGILGAALGYVGTTGLRALVFLAMAFYCRRSNSRGKQNNPL